MTHKKIKVALVGNPNSGKETAFNTNHRCAGLESHNSDLLLFANALGDLEVYETHNIWKKTETC